MLGCINDKRSWFWFGTLPKNENAAAWPAQNTSVVDR